MAWRSLFEVRLNAGFWYINSQQQYHRSKCWGSFDFSTADEVVAPRPIAAVVISSIVWTRPRSEAVRRMTFNEIALLAFALIVVALFSLFTVPQTSQALIVRLGNPVRAISEPGLHMKIPLIDSVIYVDNRILDLESGAEEVIASDQKRLVVEAFARYRIRSPLRFYQTVGSIDGANSRLSPCSTRRCGA